MIVDCSRCARFGFDARCAQCRADAPAADAAARAVTQAKHVAWFVRTGHCGQCGNPGTYCTCTYTAPCGCAQLHEVGSAGDLGPFIVRTIDAIQDDLFGGES